MKFWCIERNCWISQGFRYADLCYDTSDWPEAVSWHNQSQPKDSVLCIWVVIGQSLMRYDESDLHQHWGDEDEPRRMCCWRSVTRLDQCAEGHQGGLLHENCWLSFWGRGREGRICNALTVDCRHDSWAELNLLGPPGAGGKASNGLLNEELFTARHAPFKFNLQLELLVLRYFFFHFYYWLSASKTRLRLNGSQPS